MDPINYLAAVPQEDFLRDIQGGLQLGAGIQQVRQQQLAQQIAQQRAAQYQADATAFQQNPTAQGALALSLKYPDQAKPITEAYGAYTGDQQKVALKDAATLTNLLHAGRDDLASQEIADRIDAAKNSGLPTNELEALQSLVKSDPKAAYAHALTVMAALPGGGDVLKNLQGQSESDVKVAGGQVDNTLKGYQITAQKAAGLAKAPGLKPSQVTTFLQSEAAAGRISPDELDALKQSVPSDPKALPDFLGSLAARGLTPDQNAKLTTPDANAKLQSETSIRTTGMNVAGQKAVQQMITDRQDSKGDAEPTLDADTLTTMAQQYLAGDKGVMQNLGRGAQGAANVVALRQAITKEAKAQGLTGPQIAAQMADYQGMTAGIRTSANISARVENAAAEAANLAPLAIAAGREVSRSGFLPFGKLQVMFDTQTNDPKLKRFATANIGLATAYANAMARGQKATVEDNKHSRELLATATSQDAYEAVVNQMLQEIATARKAPEEVRQNLRGQISNRGGYTVVPNPVAAPSLPAGWTVQVH